MAPIMAKICTAMSQYAYRLGVVGILLACVLQVIGFSTEYWVISGLSWSHHGLWRNCSCVIVNCVCRTIIEHHVDAWFRAVHVLETVGLAGLVLAYCCALVRLARRKSLTHCLVFIVLLASIAGLCILSGVWIFGCNGTTQKPEGVDTFHVGYSFVLCCCSGVIAVISALLVCMDARQPRNTGFTELADPIDVGDRRYLVPVDPPGYTPPPAYEQEPPPYDQQPPLYDQQPPAYDQQPPVYDQQPPRYDQQPYEPSHRYICILI